MLYLTNPGVQFCHYFDSDHPKWLIPSKCGCQSNHYKCSQFDHNQVDHLTNPSVKLDPNMVADRTNPSGELDHNWVVNVGSEVLHVTKFG